MKLAPFHGPLWWRLALSYIFLLGTSNDLSLDKQHFKTLFIEN